MNQPPAFQFYADDFLGGTVSMTNEEKGMYITALCIQWNKGGVSEEEMDRIGRGMAVPSLSHVKAKFKQHPDRLFRNHRMEQERRKQNAYRANRSESGKTGAKKRWHSHSTAIKQPMAKHSSPSPSPSPSTEGKENGASLPSLLLAEWNRVPGLKRCLLISDKRRHSIAARLREPFFIENWKSAIQRISQSKFCLGENQRGWVASFDWFITPDAVVKIMEGKYDGVAQMRQPTHREPWKQKPPITPAEIMEVLSKSKPIPLDNQP